MPDLHILYHNYATSLYIVPQICQIIICCTTTTTDDYMLYHNYARSSFLSSYFVSADVGVDKLLVMISGKEAFPASTDIHGHVCDLPESVISSSLQ